MRTKQEHKRRRWENFQAERGVKRHVLFSCLENIRPKDFEELVAIYGTSWSDDSLSKQWTCKQVDGLTLFSSDAVAGCLIAWEAAPHHWTCGMVANENFKQIGLAATRYLKRYLRPVLMGQRVRRLSCIVDARHAEAVHWLSFLGFECEGRLRQYGVDGRDFFMMAFLPKYNKFRELAKMCSPQQAIGTQSLSEEIDDFRIFSDTKTQQQMWERAASIEAAERASRQKEQEALIRAGKRFGRGQTIGKRAARNAALYGTLGRSKNSRAFPKRPEREIHGI